MTMTFVKEVLFLYITTEVFIVSSLSCLNGSKIITCDGNVTSCYYTATLQKNGLKFDTENKKPIYHTACDVDGVCNNLNKTQENKIIEIRDENGTTVTHKYCCQTSECNKPVNHELGFEKQRKCYNVYKKGNESKGITETCEHDEDHCVSLSIPMEEDDLVQFYACGHDVKNLSMNVCSASTTEDPICQNITYLDQETTICCCQGNLCLKPPFNFSKSDSTLRMNANGTLYIPQLEPKHQVHTKNPIDWLFYGGLISAAVLIILIIITAIMYVRCRKKKKEANRLTFAYKRVAADSTPDDDEDIKMLLG